MYGSPVADVSNNYVAPSPSYAAPSPSYAPAVDEYGSPAADVSTSYDAPIIPSYGAPAPAYGAKGGCDRESKDWGIFQTKPCGTWKKGINDNIKESSFYSNMTKDFLTTVIKVNLITFDPYHFLTQSPLLKSK